METLDARGLSCPEPVVMMAAALKGGATEAQIVVDAAAARENVTRYCTNQGYTVDVAEGNGEWTLTAKKN